MIKREKKVFDLLPIGIAFVLGLLSSRIGLPPLVGYLAAGFILSDFWSEGKDTLAVFSEFGITILLFSIGLKLKLKELARKEVLGAGLIHFFLGLISFFLILSIPAFGLSSVSAGVIAFSLTFSSTVFVIKLLEERGDTRSRYGRVSIGILIIQDIIAVVFMAASSDGAPSVWALLLIAAIWPIRKLLSMVVSWVSHGELLVLLGIVVALSGAFLFDQVNIKGDLGALVFGYLLSSHSRAAEINKALLSFKNFFLLGFFLSIGMYGAPTLEQTGIALLFCFALPFRSALYYILFNRSGLRSRTSFFGSSSLLNYSEFGLIVMAVAVKAGWVSSYWISVLALTIAFSYVIAAFFNSKVGSLYQRVYKVLKRHEIREFHPSEADLNIGNANVLVFGLGRVGRGAYEALVKDVEWTPLGFDFSTDAVEALTKNGLNVQFGDASNPDFWVRMNPNFSKIRLVMLALPLAKQNMVAARELRKKGYKGAISSIARYTDEIEDLQEAGIDRAFYLYAEAGVGFAESSSQLKSDR